MWLLLLLVSVSLALNCWRSRQAKSTNYWRIGAAISILSAASAALTTPNPLILRKIATQLAMPCGIVWVGLLSASIYAQYRGRRRTTAVLFAVTILYTTTANRWIAQRFAAQMESRFASIDPFAQGRFDAVFVLGGGVGSNPSGSAQLLAAGDRVMLAARMFMRGQIDTLVASGKTIEELDNGGRDPKELTLEIWRDLGIPKSRILLVEGRTTNEEIANIKSLQHQHNWRRLGIITSATHMSRVLRLATRADLRLEPLPSNFEGGFEPWNELALIPDSAAVNKNHKSLKEFLAYLIGE